MWVETEDDLVERDLDAFLGVHPDDEQAISFWSDRPSSGDVVGVYRWLFTYGNGLGVTYWQNGNKRIEAFYKDGNPDGKWVEYTASQSIWAEENYVSGKRVGNRVSYYENGPLQSEVTFVDGKGNDVFVWYHSTGIMGILGSLLNGKQGGRQLYYRRNSGAPYMEVDYFNGKVDGSWVWYDTNGNITDEDIWEDGECVEMCEGDEYDGY